MKTLKTFEILLGKIVYYKSCVTIEAENQEEAEEKAQLQDITDWNSYDTQYSIIESEEVEL